MDEATQRASQPTPFLVERGKVEPGKVERAKPATRPVEPILEFGPFRVDPLERTLTRQGERISLTPKAFEILLTLVRHAGHVLKKEELLELVWPNTFVDENNLTQNISALRKALGESSGKQVHIETVPRLGYRFVAAVREVPPAPVPVEPAQFDPGQFDLGRFDPGRFDPGWFDLGKKRPPLSAASDALPTSRRSHAR